MEFIIRFDGRRINTIEQDDQKTIVQIVINEEGTFCKCGNWLVQIETLEGSRMITALCQDPFATRKHYRHKYKLREGTLVLCDEDGREVSAKFYTRAIDEVTLESDFGITEPVRVASPNRTFRSFWDASGELTGAIHLLGIATDGRCSWNRREYDDPEVVEDLRLFKGDVAFVVEDANWAVAVFYYKDSTDTRARVVLYTEESDGYIVSRRLERYLESNSDYGLFSDIPEKYIIE